MSYAPNGDLVTGNPDGTVTFWNPATGTQRGPSVLVSTGPVTSIAFDQAGGRFATAGLDDGTVKLWSTTSLQQIGTALPTDPGSGATVAFSPTGAHLFALDGAEARLSCGLGTGCLHDRRPPDEPRRIPLIRRRRHLQPRLSLTTIDGHARRIEWDGCVRINHGSGARVHVPGSPSLCHSVRAREVDGVAGRSEMRSRRGRDRSRRQAASRAGLHVAAPRVVQGLSGYGTADVARRATSAIELGGRVAFSGPGGLTYVALSDSWIIINVGGGPTDDKPTVTLQTPRDPDRVSSFLNIRVKDIAAVYAEWSARGRNGNPLARL